MELYQIKVLDQGSTSPRYTIPSNYLKLELTEQKTGRTHTLHMYEHGRHAQWYNQIKRLLPKYTKQYGKHTIAIIPSEILTIPGNIFTENITLCDIASSSEVEQREINELYN